MRTARLADRQIRAAQQAALRLDVRGPVSEALGRTGVVIPPAERTPAEGGTAAPLAEGRRVTPSSTPSAPRDRQDPVSAPSPHGVQPAQRVVKPFQEATWPTQSRRYLEPEAQAGLTGDERRVQTALIEALDQRARLGIDRTGVAGLSYAERKSLQALDLAFIDDQLASMTTTLWDRSPQMRLAAGFFAAGLLVALTLSTAVGQGPGVSGWLTVLMFVAIAAGGLRQIRTGGRPERRRIYEALRQLALLTNDPGPATSEAIRQSDDLMDQLAAEAARQQAPASFLRLDDEVVAEGSSTTVRRAPVRS